MFIINAELNSREDWDPDISMVECLPGMQMTMARNFSNFSHGLFHINFIRKLIFTNL